MGDYPLAMSEIPDAAVVGAADDETVRKAQRECVFPERLPGHYLFRLLFEFRKLRDKLG